MYLVAVRPPLEIEIVSLVISLVVLKTFYLKEVCCY